MAIPAGIAAIALALGACQTTAQSVPVAECQVVQRDGGAPPSPPMRIYPKLRGDTLFRLSQKYFAEFRFDALSSVVTVDLLLMPNYPWTLGERVAHHAVLETGHGRPSDLAIDEVSPGAVLRCHETD